MTMRIGQDKRRQHPDRSVTLQESLGVKEFPSVHFHCLVCRHERGFGRRRGKGLEIDKAALGWWDELHHRRHLVSRIAVENVAPRGRQVWRQ
jgi:hypothetical protein